MGEKQATIREERKSREAMCICVIALHLRADVSDKSEKKQRGCIAMRNTAK